MKSLPLVFALTAFCAVFVVAQKAEPNQAEPKKEAVPVSPAAPTGEKVKNVTPDEVEKLLGANKEIVVLDVRTPEEFELGHIAGAKNIDFHQPDFKQKVGALDKSKTYLLHCQAGVRSAKAEAVMKELQFKSILHLKEGFGKWESSGKPVEK